MESMAGLLGRGEPHSIGISIKDGVVLSDEDVTKDPQGPCGRWDVHCHETRQADCFAHLGFLGNQRDGVQLQRQVKNTHNISLIKSILKTSFIELKTKIVHSLWITVAK